MITVFTESVFIDQTHVEDSFRTGLSAFIIIYDGTITMELNNLESTYKSGNVIPISHKNLYKLKGFSEELKAYIVAVKKDLIKDKVNFNFNRYDVYRISNLDQSGNLLYFSKEEILFLAQLAENVALYTRPENEMPFKEEIVLSIFSTFIYILSSRLLDNLARLTSLNSRKESITMDFIDLVSLNFKKEKGLTFYAEKLFISIKYLSNCVRETTHLPPTKFITDAIVNEAKILLLNSKDTVRIIADELGFSDQYAFGKFFKKHTGYSPRHFKIKNKLVDPF